MCARFTYEDVSAHVVRPDSCHRVCGLDDLGQFFTHTLRAWELWWFSPLDKPLALPRHLRVEVRRQVQHPLPLSCVNQALA